MFFQSVYKMIFIYPLKTTRTNGYQYNHSLSTQLTDNQQNKPKNRYDYPAYFILIASMNYL